MLVNNSIDFLDNFSGDLGGPTTGLPPTESTVFGWFAGKVAAWGIDQLNNLEFNNLNSYYYDDGFGFYDTTLNNSYFFGPTWEFQ